MFYLLCIYLYVCYLFSFYFIFFSLSIGSWPGRSYYGGLDCTCELCGANFWFAERCKRLSNKKRLVYTRCCHAGKISLPIFPDWPSPLAELLRFYGGPESTRFLRLIREYNSMFAFTSLGVHVDKSVNIGRGPYVFKIYGVVYHEIGSLLPPEDNPVPKFSQLYIFDTYNELHHRMNIFSSGGIDNENSVDHEGVQLGSSSDFLSIGDSVSSTQRRRS